MIAAIGLTSSLENTMRDLSGASISVAFYGVVAMMIFQLGVFALSYFMNAEFNLKPVFTTIVMLIFIAGYDEAVGTLDKGLDAFIEIPHDYLVKKKLATSMNEKMIQYERNAQVNTDDKWWWESAMEKMQSFHESVMKDIFEFIISWLAKIVAFVYNLLAIFLGLILYAIGPLAIFTSTIPGIGNQIFLKWLSSFIHVKFWLLTIYLIEAVNSVITTNVITSVIDILPIGDITLVATLAVQIIFVIFYFMVPKLTNLYMPSDVAGLATSVAKAATAAMGGVAMAAGGGAAAAKFLGGNSAVGQSVAQRLGNVASMFGNAQSKVDDVLYKNQS